MASMRMMPSDVVTAHAEYSFSPTKYRLSKTLAGSTCQALAGGGPAGRGPEPVLASRWARVAARAACTVD